MNEFSISGLKDKCRVSRQEHMASEQKVRESREMRKNCRDDICTLSRSFHETCSLKEEAEKQLNKLKKMYREVTRLIEKAGD